MSTASPVKNQASATQSRHASDRYIQNAAAAQVIEAEYVEVNSPASKDFHQELQDLTNSITPEDFDLSAKTPAMTKTNNALASYQQRPNAPPPGTYINLFA